MAAAAVPPRSQIRNSAIYMIPVVLGNVIPLATLPLLTRALTKEAFGVLALAQFYAAFASALANFGLLIGYERNFFQHRDPQRAAALLYSTLLFVSAALALILVLTWIYRVRLSALIIGSPDHGVILFWATVAAGAISLKSYYLTYFKNTEDAPSYVWYSMDENLVGVLLAAVLVVYFGAGVLGMITGQLAATLVVLAVVAGRVGRRLAPSLDLRLLAASLRLSYPLTPRLFLNLVGTQFDKYLIGRLASIGGVGLYSIAQKIAGASFQFITALANVFVPHTYRRMFDGGEEARADLGRYLTVMAYVSLSVPFGLALFGEELLRLLTPASFHGAGVIVAILALYYGWLYFSKINAVQLIYRERTGMTSIITMVSVVLTIVFSLLLIPRWGTLGAAAGVLGSGILSGIFSWVIGQHCFPIAWQRPHLGMLLVVFFGSGLSLVLLTVAGTGYGVRLAVKIAWLALYVGTGLRAGVITRARLREVGEVLTNRRLARAR